MIQETKDNCYFEEEKTEAPAQQPVQTTNHPTTSNTSKTQSNISAAPKVTISLTLTLSLLAILVNPIMLA